ncbi:folate family ECF transporter S component [Periweissella cryptocerci]|uniref:Folate family ECF transporter S component n=1 Tax=Periweissella cryptocerci TaxID=2506420 RepID=A0A4P6YRT5_9LACO|nr:folate family ECF transporter S component [Periweissella cryptocerci]QBO35312.1 folate family ECF transporter S component [Periweissella cryptocerci]
MKTLSLGYAKLSTKRMALLGILIAMQIILGRFTFGPSYLKFGVTFIIVALIAKWYGPLWGGTMAIFSDYIGNLLNGDAYYFGFTLSAIAGVVIYGLFFYNHERLSWGRIIIATVLVLLIVNTFMNTLWIAQLSGLHDSAALKLLEVRALKQLIMAPIQVILIYTITNNRQLESLKQLVFAD